MFHTCYYIGHKNYSFKLYMSSVEKCTIYFTGCNVRMGKEWENIFNGGLEVQIKSNES